MTCTEIAHCRGTSTACVHPSHLPDFAGPGVPAVDTSEGRTGWREPGAAGQRKLPNTVAGPYFQKHSGCGNPAACSCSNSMASG